jgi:hypothetical protein
MRMALFIQVASMEGMALASFPNLSLSKTLLTILIDGNLEKQLDELDKNDEDFEIKIEAVFSDQEVLHSDEVDEW